VVVRADAGQRRAEIAELVEEAVAPMAPVLNSMPSL
jgi:hypothetical protein